MSIQLLDELIGARNRPMVLRRLRWLEDRLHWHGVLRRSDLASRFGISPQQASQDIAIYQELAPGRAVLDSSTKTYMPGTDGALLFPKDAFRWIAEATAEGDTTVIPLERVTAPARRAEDVVMAALISSHEARLSVEITYQSLSSAEPIKRVICPHHFVDTGDRYHVRAWDDLRRRFSDFVVGRILKVGRKPDYPWVDGIADTLWHEHAEMALAPGKGLSAAQRLAVERDYGMESGRIVLSVRKALITYVAERLGVLDELQGETASGKVRQVRCLNPEDLMPLVPPRG